MSSGASTTFVDLSRFQFATTAAFHMTFPALSVGLAIFLVICYGAYCRTGNPLIPWHPRPPPVTIQALLRAFPPGAGADPELALVRAGGDLVQGHLDEAAAHLAVAE